MSENDLENLCEKVWNTAYPDRRKWNSIPEEARAEWRRVFIIYNNLRQEMPAEQG